MKTPLADWAAEGFAAGEPLLFIGAAGIAVRAIAGCIRDKLTDVPVLVMYPGTFDGRYVKLFDKLTPNPYYRAFNVI